MINELALRYGKAFFSLTQEQRCSEAALNELRVVLQALTENPEIVEFLASSMVTIDDRRMVLAKALENKLTPITYQFLSTLLENERIQLLGGIVQALEMALDELHGAVRGKVTSARPLSAEERKRVEEEVSKARGKKVILSFEEDSSLMGGMIAQVSGWTFDDSIKSHLAKIGDELNRRAHTWN